MQLPYLAIRSKHKVKKIYMHKHQIFLQRLNLCLVLPSIIIVSNNYISLVFVS
jgi:hypothetical protein